VTVQRLCAFALCLLVAGCKKDDPGLLPQPMTREQLLDPATCAECHPSHYREWASSMHAYAAEDPVFRAMNQRGQRETGGELGDFCVKCHAPMAVIENATFDGLDIDEVPPHLRGVTCYFCHNAVEVTGHFNNGVRLANDLTLRGAIADPVDPGVHGVAYSKLHDRNRPESAELCGSCHDVMTPSGVHLERTFAEYRGSLFTSEAGFETCQGCHMDARPGRAATSGGAPPRTVHEHLWPGVDVALSEFPDTDVQLKAVECALATSARVLSVARDRFGTFTVLVETNAGHHQPSGAAQDRRLWIEFIAYAADGSVLFQSGVIGDGELEQKPEDDPGYDRQLALFRDYLYGADGAPVHQFWQAAPSALFPEGHRSLVLPAAAVRGTAHSIAAQYQLSPAAQIARVTVRLRMRPVGLDVLRDLVESRDLSSDVLDRMPTFTLHGAAVEWTPEAPDRLRSLWPAELDCPDDYRCLLEPTSVECTTR
jgi:hypothetical protein